MQLVLRRVLLVLLALLLVELALVNGICRDAMSGGGRATGWLRLRRWRL